MEIQREIKIIEFIEYDGIRFYKDQRGYWLSKKASRTESPKRLHVYVWEKYNGPVLNGYHIHHIDHNTDNNDIENLKLMERFEHLQYHARLQDKDKIRINLNENARPKAVEWHKSEIGKKWHKEHYENMKDKLSIKLNIKCLMCGKEVEVSKGGKGNKFCSINCKQKYRKLSGVDNITSICIGCGKEFTKDKYSKKVYCSKSCSCRANALKSYKSRQIDENGRFKKEGE